MHARMHGLHVRMPPCMHVAPGEAGAVASTCMQRQVRRRPSGVPIDVSPLPAPWRALACSAKGGGAPRECRSTSRPSPRHPPRARPCGSGARRALHCGIHRGHALPARPECCLGAHRALGARHGLCGARGARRRGVARHVGVASSAARARGLTETSVVSELHALERGGWIQAGGSGCAMDRTLQTRVR